MDLIKLGHRYINLSNVYQVSFNDRDRENNPEKALQATLDVITSVSIYPDDDASTTIEAAGMLVWNEEAEALRHYLDGKAVDVEAAYTHALEQEERNRQQEEKDRRFKEFCKVKGLEGDARYSYECWLNSDHATLEDNEVGELSFTAWQASEEEWFDQQVKNTARAAFISEFLVVEFKEWCRSEGITRPGFSDVSRWERERRPSTNSAPAAGKV